MPKTDKPEERPVSDPGNRDAGGPSRPAPVCRVGVVFNPVTGGDQAPQRRRAITAALRDAGIEVLWLETTAEDPGEGLTRRALQQGADLILAAGGDGTVRACASGLADSGVPLAVLPGGTGNLLAVNLGLPADLEDAIQVALRGARRRIDVGAVGGRRFVVMAGMGFDAAMLADASPRLKARLGALAYVASGLRHLRRDARRFRLWFDGAAPIVRMGQGVLIANLGRLQGGLPVLPDARPDDGVLDVAVIQTRSLGDWVRLAARVLLRAGGSGPPLELFRARSVQVECDRPQLYQLDGDTAGPVTRLDIHVAPAALTLCVPLPPPNPNTSPNPHQEAQLP